MESLTPRIAILAVVIGVSVPSSAQIVVRGPLAYDHAVTPGQQVTQEFAIENTGDEVVTATIYQTDYTFLADGTNAYDDPGTAGRSNADWIQFSPSVVTLDPDESALVRYSVAVPGGSTGTYWSMLMVEGQPGDLISGTGANRGQVGLRQVTRYGVQVATHVSDTGTATLQFENGLLSSGPDGPVLQIDVVNTGENMLRPAVALRLVDSEGREHGPFATEPRRVYPGTSIRELIPMPGIPPGRYSAILVADGGGEHVFGLQLDLTL